MEKVYKLHIYKRREYIERMKKTRCRYKFSLKDYSKALELSYNTIKKYSAERKFDPKNIKSICELYYKRKLRKER